MGAAEPHTITFMFDNSTFAGVVSPLSVSNTTEFTAIPSGSNNEPILIPGEGGTNTLVAVNARTYSPVTIDSQDKVQFMNPNANYSVAGDEKYVNSGWILPEGLEKQYPGTWTKATATKRSPLITLPPAYTLCAGQISMARIPARSLLANDQGVRLISVSIIGCGLKLRMKISRHIHPNTCRFGSSGCSISLGG